MKEGKRKTVLVLSILAIASALLISLMAQYARPLIEANRKKVLKQAIFSVLPTAERFQKANEQNKIYYSYDSNNNLVGYAFVGEGGGYQGIIRIMIGISTDWQTLEGIYILENVETPGLGAKITSKDFLRQFKGLRVKPEIEYVQNKSPEQPNQIRAITGATISSRAVVNILNKTIARVEIKINRMNHD